MRTIDLTEPLFESEPVRMKPQLAAARRLVGEMQRGLPPQRKKEVAHQICACLVAMLGRNDANHAHKS